MKNLTVHRPTFSLTSHFFSRGEHSCTSWYWAMGLRVNGRVYSVAVQRKNHRQRAFLRSGQSPKLFEDVRLSLQLSRAITSVLTLYEHIPEGVLQDLLSSVADVLEGAYPHLEEMVSMDYRPS